MNTSPDMVAISEIRERLTEEQASRATSTPQGIFVAARNDDGFDVEILACDGEYVVSYGVWHERFQDVEEALRCFLFGLTPECRLKVTSYGDFEQRWTLEVMADGRWEEYGSTGLLFFPFWRTKRVDYRRNA